MPRSAPIDVAIIGGGVAGLATAFFAARGGKTVALLEREPHFAAHSSGKNAAIQRTVIDDPRLRDIARASARFFLDPPAGFSETPIVDPCGLLLTADAEHAAALEEWATGSPGAERADRRRVAQLAPQYTGPCAGAVWLPHEGRLDIAAMIEGFARGARAAGARLRTAAAVTALLGTGRQVRGVRLASGEELLARTTVLAAGGWAGRLGAASGSRVQLRPTRRHLAVTPADPTIDPGGPVVWTAGDPFYYRPESGGWLISACDQTDVDPDACTSDPAVRELCLAKAARNLAPEPAGTAHFWCGMRTLTADGRFAIGPDPDVEGLFWVAGLGGHGMVCSAEVGRLAAQALENGAPVADLEPARLARGEVLSPGSIRGAATRES